MMAAGEKFTHYRTFEDEYTARVVLLDLLEGDGIPYEGLILKTNEDHHISAVVYKAGYAVSIRLEDFEKVEQLLDKAAEGDLVNIDKGHYLYQFTIEELKEVIERPYDWSKNDYAIAIKLLHDVGYNITPAELEQYKKKHYAEMAKPKTITTFELFMLYFKALAGGLLAVIEGRHLYKSTIAMPDGKVFYEYDKRSRNHGILVYWLGIMVIFTYATYFVIQIFMT